MTGLILKRAIAAALTACTVLGAAAEKPQVEKLLPARWNFAADTISDTAPCPPGWWQAFGDTLLDSLENAALDNNFDVRMAIRRIAMSQAQANVARAAYMPNIGIEASYTRSRTSGLTTDPGVPAEKAGFFSAGVSLSWEIDLFGKITAQYKVSKAQVRLSRVESEAVRLAVTAQMASAYVQLRVHQAQLDVATRHSKSQREVLRIAQARFDTGLASMMDVNQAQQVYYSTIAQIPLLESSIRSDINAIALLLGIPTTDISRILVPVRPIPDYHQLVHVGMPAELLDRRPDVVEAQRQIEVAAARAGVEKKQWLPSLTVTASAGTEAHKAGDLFRNNSFTYSIVPTISWTVFDGLARKNNIAEARESLRNAVDNYNLTILNAANEVDNAIEKYRATLRYIGSLNDVIEASKSYNTRAVDNYRNGLSPFINVADAQLTYLEYVNFQIEARGNALTALIDLYKALGGGWSDDENTSAE